MEYFMVTVRVGTETFYETAIRLEAERRAEREAEVEAAELRVLRDATGEKSADFPGA